ncbi:protein I'm not dead yet-like [Hermetia illucens]|uniref:protein I'm not dead yet-like n=1 Tax=Hermetia illucens TaxID=343691 RepID=UPI0018CC3078|nr:protein I'm not dead yet-like [Hermetia illucens]
MAIYWVTEALPLAVTSMIPIVMFPCLGILDTNRTTMCYFKETNVMFIGGLILALAIEFCNLHNRIALKVISIVGCSQPRLNLGLMSVTMFVSMWISNTAATAMMCPIIVAILEELERQGIGQFYTDKKVDEEAAEDSDEPPNPSRTSVCYFMGAAYASSIGGLGSLIGTGTNLTFKGIYESRFPAAPGIDFPRWTFYNVPPMLAATFLTYLYLQIVFAGMFRPKSQDAKASNVGPAGEEAAKEVIAKRYQDLGPIRSHEIFVAILFILSILLYFSRSPGFFPGWADVIAPKTSIKDATPAIFIVIALFMIPAVWSFFKFCRGGEKLPKKPSTGLITWGFVHTHTPWSLVFLLGGGFALAEGSSSSGMSELLGNALSGLKSLPPLAILFIVLLSIQFLTEFTSNVAIANITLPVLAEMAVVIRIHPLYLMMPAAITASYAFHLPVGTPPNALVAGYANIRTKEMSIAGIGPTIITLLLIWITFPTYGLVIYPEMSKFPPWATKKGNSTSF